MNLAHGLDISQHQKNFPYQSAADAGFSFGYVRASIRDDRDPRYHEHRIGLRAAGILQGSYHFLTPDVGVERQIATFYRQLDGGDDLPPAVDVEAKGLTAEIVRECLEDLSALVEQVVMVYTSAMLWYRLVGRGAEWARSYLLWVADWRNSSDDWLMNQRPPWDKLPAIPYPWECCQWTVWQYTSKGRVPGYSRNVDLNWWDGAVVG